MIINISNTISSIGATALTIAQHSSSYRRSIDLYLLYVSSSLKLIMFYNPSLMGSSLIYLNHWNAYPVTMIEKQVWMRIVFVDLGIGGMALTRFLIRQFPNGLI
ncbi:hypothetical protein A3Q56_08643 [Intoshia linei]|uniref:Uncharacterized protein n=1 Tax=Intoshia linei TaxID=1819745 RepID=A0A177AQ55_9BILA|nr:hypothetical protein A3Q56_08643 [Intoshia linei]